VLCAGDWAREVETTELCGPCQIFPEERGKWTELRITVTKKPSHHKVTRKEQVREKEAHVHTQAKKRKVLLSTEQGRIA
jgi:hypothetical protein